MLRSLACAGLAFLVLPNVAWSEDDIAHILARNEAPTGVVFEIVTSDAQALQTLLPKVRDYVTRLRARFPEVGLAVVSHGREELALTRGNRERYGEVHRQVQDLVGDRVPVHVCGTYAGWQGVSPEEFPPYVDVVSQGPTQLRDYREFGYLHVVVGH